MTWRAVEHQTTEQTTHWIVRDDVTGDLKTGWGGRASLYGERKFAERAASKLNAKDKRNGRPNRRRKQGRPPPVFRPARKPMRDRGWDDLDFPLIDEEDCG